MAAAEALLVYGLVALAAAWTVWKLVLPRAWRRRLLKRGGRGCGDGGCERCD